MKKILLNNLSLKLLALILGIFLWIAVMYNLNPMTTKTINVPVHIENGDVLSEKNWKYSVIGSNEVEVTIKAKSLDLAKITADDLYLYVDMKYLSGNSGTERQGTIRYTLKNSAIEGITLEQDYLSINLEEIITRDYKVDVQIIGDVAENYTTGTEPTSVPEYVTIKGPKTQVEKIAKVVYYLALEDASEDINIIAKPELIDVNGDVLDNLEDVRMSPEEVQICLPIYQTKVVIIECDTENGATVGEPATGYGIGDIVLDTDGIKISGYKAILSSIVSIKIPAELINVEGLTETQTFKINLDDLDIPEGVTILGDDHMVNVTVKIEKKKQNNFRLKLPDDITIKNKNDEYIYSFKDNSIYITVEGISKELSDLQAENIIASIDVDGLGLGEASVKLDVTLPEDISLVSEVRINVIIDSKESETETTEETTTEEPTTVVPVTIPVPVTEPVTESPTTMEEPTTAAESVSEAEATVDNETSVTTENADETEAFVETETIENSYEHGGEIIE